MMTGGAPSRREALEEAAQRLRAAGADSPRRDAEELLAHALGLSRSALLLELDFPLEEGSAYEALLRRREGREPLQQVLGEWDFRSLTLVMRPGVFIPRPETELLVGQVLAALKADFPRGPLRGLEMGVGSGAIALALLQEQPRLSLRASDVSEAALSLAGENARHLALNDRLGLELRSGLPSGDEPVHLIVSNPPYVALGEGAGLAPEVAEYDPPEALFSGEDGLDACRALLAEAPSRLLPGGLLALEHGDLQAQALAALATEAGLLRLEPFRDLAGRDRGLLARKALS